MDSIIADVRNAFEACVAEIEGGCPNVCTDYIEYAPTAEFKNIEDWYTHLFNNITPLKGEWDEKQPSITWEIEMKLNEEMTAVKVCVNADKKLKGRVPYVMRRM